ncbi:B-cell antigen receptor complex-associated protein beta chain [Pogona vitticeps]
MAASLFHPCGVFRVTMGLVLAVTGMNTTEINRTYQKSGPATSLELTHVRFIAAKRGSTIYFHCIPDAKAKWYKTSENGKEQELTNNSRIHLAVNDSRMTMRIKKIEGTDSGIYFCARNISYGCCGTELKVMGASTFEQVRDRHMLKDTIILIQSVLLVLFVSMPLLLTRGKGGSKDTSHEDHTYEGLMVEMADTYEDIGNYQEKLEKWNLGEHPSEE